MGADDDAGCIGHVWVLAEVHVTPGGADRASICTRCGIPRYEPGQATSERRPPL